MYRIDTPTSSPTLPAPAAAGPQPDSYWTGGNPASGTLATIVAAEWWNMVQEELCNVINNQGALDPILNKSLRNQLLLAIRREVAAGITVAPPPPAGGGSLPALQYTTTWRRFNDTPTVPAPPGVITTSCSMTLAQAGNYNIWGHIGFDVAAGSALTVMSGAIGVGNNTVWPDSTTGLSCQRFFGGYDFQGERLIEFYCGQAIVNVPAATTVYLLGLQQGDGTLPYPNLYGFMGASRV